MLPRTAYRTVVVGGGVVGLFTAYHLARAGAGPILVVDRGFLSGGASGRNGGGVRQQWETRSTVRLAREAVESYRRFGREFGYNPWFRQTGYLFLAEGPEELARLERVHGLVRSEGLASELVHADRLAQLVPGIARSAAVGGTYLASDGVLYPFPVVWGVYEAIRTLGVDLAFGVEVGGIRSEGGCVTGVQTSSGSVATGSVVNAAGGWSAEVARRAGLALPNVATRHEILATEPVAPFLDPMVVRASDGLYFSQTVHGGLVGGISVTHPPGKPDNSMPSSTKFLTTMARALVGILPRLRGLRVLRAWSGFYDDTPDGLPVLGEDPRLRGFVHANGFGGHGFMLAPAATRRVARAVLGEKTDLDPAEFAPDRFLGSGTNGSAERLQLG